MKLQITKEKVLEAASKCSTAKETLKTLFPEVFKMEFNKDKIYAFKHIYDNIYKLHRGVDGIYKWLSLGSSFRQWNNDYKSGEEALESFKEKNIQVFDNQKDFFTWALKQVS